MGALALCEHGCVFITFTTTMETLSATVSGHSQGLSFSFGTSLGQGFPHVAWNYRCPLTYLLLTHWGTVFCRSSVSSLRMKSRCSWKTTTRQYPFSWCLGLNCTPVCWATSSYQVAGSRQCPALGLIASTFSGVAMLVFLSLYLPQEWSPDTVLRDRTAYVRQEGQDVACETKLFCWICLQCGVAQRS